MRGIAILVLPVTTMFAVRGSSGAAALLSGTRASTTSHGLQVSVLVPRRSYPKDALVQVRVVVRNISHRAVVIDAPCGSEGPEAQSTTATGHLLYSMVFHPTSGLSTLCHNQTAPRLAPRHVLEVRQYLVLEGPGIRGFVPLAGNRWAQTRPALVRLTPARPLRVNMRSKHRVEAMIPRPPGAQGPLLWYGWSACLEHGTPFSSPNYGWVRSSSDVATPLQARERACSQITEWHAIAGYLNYPVAIINYRVPVSVKPLPVKP